MNILLAGDWHSHLHEEPVAEALRAVGHTVVEFRWCEYFAVPRGIARTVRHLSRRAQNKYLWGPQFQRMNDDLVGAASAGSFDLIFVYRGSHISRETLDRIHAANKTTIIAGYNNDDPFSPKYPRWLWRHFLAAVPAYDLLLAYRHANVSELRDAGAKRVELLRSWFLPNVHRPVAVSADDVRELGSDVVFVGHFEPDGRLKLLESIARSGLTVRIFGPGRGFPGFDWERLVRRSRWLRGIPPVRLVWGEEYTKALCASRVALCFLSKLNRDTYTRRCFEIPATRTLLMSEYSDDLATLFDEGREAEFFRNEEELLRKVKTYVGDDEHRVSVASAGYRRVYSDGHDVVSRMKEVIRCVQSMK